MKITKENFISELKLRNEKALEFVVEEYGWVIKTTARKYLQKRYELADECFNDVLLAVWNNIGSFDISRNTFQNWLAGVSRFKAIDCKRKYLKGFNEEPLEAGEDVSDEGSGGEFLKQEILEELQDMLSCLKPQDRRIFEHMFWNGESVKTISRATGLKESSVYNHISRGRKKIREHLSRAGRGNI